MTELHDKIKRIRQLDKDLIPEAKEDKQRFLHSDYCFRLADSIGVDHNKIICKVEKIKAEDCH